MPDIKIVPQHPDHWLFEALTTKGLEVLQNLFNEKEIKIGMCWLDDRRLLMVTATGALSLGMLVGMKTDAEIVGPTLDDWKKELDEYSQVH